MADSPDISKVVSLIMEHPEIVGQISSLLSGEGKDAEPTAGEATEESAPVSARPIPKSRSDRARLLGAMKPYLSKNRAQAVDTMITVTEILDSMKRGG